MKKLLVLFTLLFSLTAHTYYPLALTPETLQSMRVGLGDGELSIGGELTFTGDKKNIIEKWFGDNLKWNHSFSGGFITNNFENPSLYGTAYVFFESGTVGTGVKQILFYDSNFSSQPHGQTIYFAYYYFDSTSIFFGEGKEFLSMYLGFRSESINIIERSAGEFFSSLKDVSEVPIIGIYYNPDVSEAVSVGLETDFKTTWLNIYFSFF